MIYHIGLLVVPLVCGIIGFLGAKPRYRFSDTLMYAATGGVLFAIFGAMFGFVSVDSSKGTAFEDNPRGLKSLNIGSETHGAFFLGIGSFGEDTKYVFYKRDGKGYVLDKIDVDEVRVVETNDVKPMIVENMIRHESNLFWPHDSVSSDYPYFYTIYVPENSIKNDIDLEIPE